MKVPALLKNKYVFYALAALAVLNIAGYAMVQAWECLALFGLSAYSAHCYSGNKCMAILAALFVANFVFGCGRVKEGMEGMLKGPEEHTEDAAQSAAQAVEQQMESGATGEEAVTDTMANIEGFVADKAACCAKEGDKFTGGWKEDLGDNQAACAAKGEAAAFCAAD